MIEHDSSPAASPHDDVSASEDGCATTLDERLLGGRPELGHERTALEARVLASVVHQRPTTVGRYVLGRTIGSGNYGTVYEAHDPKLDRRVAVKLVSVRSDTERARVVREAQLLASLSHPNVVAVFEVGLTEGVRPSPYVVMELVEGQTVREWLIAQPRTWSEVVGVIQQAARGLHAAHCAGIVHRDFKPDNALLGEDGRVRVVDFGLARPVDDAEDPTISAAHPLAHDPLRTPTGGLRGTPAYMAPEAFTGAVTPRADQYSLCVTLYESLFGRRPFVASTIDELVSLVYRNPPTLPDDRRGVPEPITDVLLRGLARQPEDRFDDLEQLVDALEAGAGPRRSRGGWIAVAGMAGLLGTGLVVGLAGGWLDPSPAPPPVPEAPAAPALDPELVAQLSALETQTAEVRQHLDSSQITASLERSAALLEQARALEHPPAEIEPLLLRGRALMLTDDFGEAWPTLEQAYFLARDHDQPRLAARAASEIIAVLGYHTDNYEDAHRWKDHAEVSFERAGIDPRTQVPYMFGLAGLTTREGDGAGAIALLREIIEHVENDERAQTSAHAALLNRLATELYSTGEIDQAIELHRRATAMFAATDGPRSYTHARALDNLGVYLTRLERFDEAEEQHLEALEIREAILDPEHIDLARSHGNLGRVLGKLGRREEALDHLDRSMELFAAKLGPGNSSVAMGHELKGEIHMDRGPEGYPEAIREYTRAARLYDGAGIIYVPAAERARAAIRAMGGTPPPAPSVPLPPLP